MSEEVNSTKEGLKEVSPVPTGKRAKRKIKELCMNEECVKDRDQAEKESAQHWDLMREFMRSIEDERERYRKEVEYQKRIVESFTALTLGKKARR